MPVFVGPQDGVPQLGEVRQLAQHAVGVAGAVLGFVFFELGQQVIHAAAAAQHVKHRLQFWGNAHDRVGGF